MGHVEGMNERKKKEDHRKKPGKERNEEKQERKKKGNKRREEGQKPFLGTSSTRIWTARGSTQAQSILFFFSVYLLFCC